MCKHGDSACGVYWTCGKCSAEDNKRAWARLTPAQKAYDNHVDPLGAYHTDYDAVGYDDGSCSCHINPPCSYCVNQPDPD